MLVSLPARLSIVCDLIRGKSVAQAQRHPDGDPQGRFCALLSKLVKSAAANAENNYQHGSR